MNKSRERQIEESIIRILRNHKEGLGISEISKKIHVYRATVSKYLLSLQHRGIVVSKRVGPAKIYYLRGKRCGNGDEDWIDELIKEIKDELKREILGRSV